VKLHTVESRDHISPKPELLEYCYTGCSFENMILY